jgi:hypothetical protein
MNMKKMTFNLPVKFLSVFIVLQVVFSGGISAAADNKNLTPILHLLLSDKKIVTATVKDGVIVVDDTAAQDILAVSVDEVSGNSQLQVQGGLATTLQPGSIINIVPGAEAQFPFGLSGRVLAITSNPDGTKTVTLEHVSYAEVMKESQVNLSDISLDASNFIGVIAPSAVEASDSALIMSKANLDKSEYSFRNGAIVVRNSVSSGGMLGVQKDITSGATVSLNARIKLADMGVDASKMVPFAAGTEASILVSGELNNIKLTNDVDFSVTNGLKKLKLRLDGQLNAKVQFNAAGTATFGYFSQAWKEVEDEQQFPMSQKALLHKACCAGLS